MIHSTADVKSQKIGANVQIWQFTIVLGGAQIGDNCNINCHVFIENNVIIGNNVTIKSGVQLWDGLRVEDNVFIGPNVTFTNDKKPRSKAYPEQFQQTEIKKFASVGAGSTILGGTTIGSYAMVGAGAVVTKSVPERALVIGNPAKVVGWLNKDGSRMKKEDDFFIDDKGRKWKASSNKIVLA